MCASPISTTPKCVVNTTHRGSLAPTRVIFSETGLSVKTGSDRETLGVAFKQLACKYKRATLRTTGMTPPSPSLSCDSHLHTNADLQAS